MGSPAAFAAGELELMNIHSGQPRLPETHFQNLPSPAERQATDPRMPVSVSFFGVNLAENQVRATCCAFPAKSEPIVIGALSYLSAPGKRGV